jgi:hypothetical protein
MDDLCLHTLHVYTYIIREKDVCNNKLNAIEEEKQQQQQQQE